MDSFRIHFLRARERGAGFIGAAKEREIVPSTLAHRA
jgi:hypothetical protein